MLLKIKVVPSSSRDCIVGWLGEALKVKLMAPPEKGKANESLIQLLANEFKIDKSKITIQRGHTQVNKVVELPDNSKIPPISL
jgi:uncharacterized protein (TIGR00251 family)